MKLLGTHTVHYGLGREQLSLYEGDLAAIASGEAVDILLVSAFPDDYSPLPGTLIGALQERGISVEALAARMQEDLRESLFCWLSRDVRRQHPDAGFSRILCFETPGRKDPAAVVGDLFRALFPFALSDVETRKVATPLLAAGDQGRDAKLMLTAMFRAATHWFARGLPVDVIEIVVLPQRADEMRRLFSRLSEEASEVSPRSSAPATIAASPPGARQRPAGFAARTRATARAATRAEYDCFISYAHADQREVDFLVGQLMTAYPDLRLFQDKLEIKAGDPWQSDLDDVLETCRKVIPVYSPTYLTSPMCMEEFNMARLRHRETGNVLLPVYLREAKLPLYLRSLQYHDCREADLARLSACSEQLAATIAPGTRTST